MKLNLKIIFIFILIALSLGIGCLYYQISDIDLWIKKSKQSVEDCEKLHIGMNMFDVLQDMSLSRIRLSESESRKIYYEFDDLYYSGVILTFDKDNKLIKKECK